VNTVWAIGELSAFIDLTQLVTPPLAPGLVYFGDDRHCRGGADAIITQATVVEQILERVLPEWRSTVPPDNTSRWQQHREAAVRAVAVLQRQEEVAQQLGDDAPRLSAGALHPWVWDAARSFWAQAAFRVAVREAANALNAHTQAKVGRYDVADDALVGEVFSMNEPAAGRPRLRLPHAESDRTQQSRQRGARDLAQGCFWALRNPATHQVQEWDEQVALEALCALSLVARLINECNVVRAE